MDLIYILWDFVLCDVYLILNVGWSCLWGLFGMIFINLVYISWDFEFKYERRLVLFDILYAFDLKVNFII